MIVKSVLCKLRLATEIAENMFCVITSYLFTISQLTRYAAICRTIVDFAKLKQKAKWSLDKELYHRLLSEDKSMFLCMSSSLIHVLYYEVFC